MKQLKSFIFGMLTILIIIPIIESLCEIICSGMEYIKGLVCKPVLKINKELQEIQVDSEKIDDGVAIGFHYDEQDEIYDDDDDDFEDVSSNKVKCGFH